MNKNTNLVENKELREELIGRVEVLDRVGNLLLLDELEMATVDMVANYYRVGKRAIDSLVFDNKEEVESDGYKIYKKDDILLISSKEIKTKRGGFNILDKNGEVVASGSNKGIALFPKRAILRVGMLLRDSEIAKEVRTQLLNVVEVVKENNDEMLVQEIDKEKQLYMNIMFAQNDAERAIAINEHLKYMNRYKEKANRYEEVYHSDKIFTVTEVAKDLGLSARKLNSHLHNLGVQYNQNGTWHLYSKYQELVPTHCDYHITEYGQTLKWTNMGREWIIELLKENGLLGK